MGRASKKEIRRIETPPGPKSTADYALLPSDWKTLYVPVQKRSVKSFECDGEQLTRIEYGGQIRVWDVDSGKEKNPLLPTEGFGPVYGKFSPDGRLLVCVEQSTYVVPGDQPPGNTVVWEVASGKKWKLNDVFVVPLFFADGKTVAVEDYDSESKKSSVKVLDVTTMKELAKVNYPEKDRRVALGPVAPNGSVIAMYLGGKKGAPLEIWFLDGKTLEDRGKLVGKGDPDRYGWGYGLFAQGGKLFIALDGLGNVLLWDVAGQKVIRTWPSGSSRLTGRFAISPDGKTLAVGWAPKADEELASGWNQDTRDLPQPRVSLINLEGNAPPRILIAPHGRVGGVAFSPNGKTLAFGGAGAVHLFDLTK